MTLAELGWDPSRDVEFAPWASRAGYEPARVVIEFNHHYRLYIAGGEADGTISGGLKHRASARADMPAVGDWVVFRRQGTDERGALVAVLPRRSRFSRRAAGHVTDEQVVAANIDMVFVVMSMDDDFSPRRLERYLLLAREGGAEPVVILTKPDLCASPAVRATEAEAVSAGAPVRVVSPRTGDGVEVVRAALARGKTGALLGSSGVGKTTLINRLVGEDSRRTREVRSSDSKGRHTTTHRELVPLPSGGWLIDTPGMREVQLWDGDRTMGETFDDVEALASGCRFDDCRHADEPRCAVKAAVADGRLEAARLEAFVKVQSELAAVAQQRGERAQREEQRRTRTTGKTPRHSRQSRG